LQHYAAKKLPTSGQCLQQQRVDRVAIDRSLVERHPQVHVVVQRAVIRNFAVELIDELELTLRRPLFPDTEVEVHDLAPVRQSLEILTHVAEIGQAFSADSARGRLSGLGVSADRGGE